MFKKILLQILSIPLLLNANEQPKHTLNPNSSIQYNILPSNVEDLEDLLENGVFYNRIRINNFNFSWNEETFDDNNTPKTKNHTITGIGGSSVFKSGFYEGLGFTAGLWTSCGLGSLDNTESQLYKSGKDTMSRYDAISKNNPCLYSFAERYFEFKKKDFSLKLGRQIFESFLTRSNDSKMIPNSFEGLSLTSNLDTNSQFKFAYFTKQKLRDHSDFHHILAYNDNEAPYSEYLDNDDSSMHKGLTLSKLEEREISDKLFILEFKNKYIDNLTLDMNYTIVPELVSSAMIQADYKIKLGENIFKPGFRYMQQFDHGAGEIAGSNLKNKTIGYTDINSLNSSLYGFRLDGHFDSLKTRFGYTKTADRGDLIAPWRGFPTSGFTRAMGQYNWYANTESFMTQLEYKPSFLPTTTLKSNFVIQNFDDSKIGVPADSNVFTFDIIKTFTNKPLYLKSRFAHITGDEDTTVEYNNTVYTKPNPSYNELRLEINYLF